MTTVKINLSIGTSPNEYGEQSQPELVNSFKRIASEFDALARAVERLHEDGWKIREWDDQRYSIHYEAIQVFESEEEAIKAYKDLGFQGGQWRLYINGQHVEL